MVPGPENPATERATVSATLRDRILFGVFFGFLLVGLHVIRDPTTYDKTLIPRLLSAATFIAAVLAVLPWATRLGRLDARPLRDPIVLCYAAYALLTVASLAFAVNVTAGFTDVFKTLVSLIALGLSCLLLPTVPRWQEAIVKLCVVSAAVSAATGWATTIAQHGVGLHGRELMERVTGLQSSANLYAHFLDLLLPICLVGMVVLRGAWRTAAGAVAVAVAAMLVLLQTRSAYVGLAAGLVTGLVGVVACPGPLGISRRWRTALLGLFVAGFGLAATVVATAPDSNPLARRIRSIVVEPEGPTARPREGGRLAIWSLTSRIIADHPLTGVGAGNFTIRLHEYFDTDFEFARIHTTNWTQPHNDLLWVWAEKGAFALAAFVGIFIAALLAIRTVLRGPASRQDAWLALGIAMSLVAYSAGSVFDFPLERVSHQVVLAVLLAAVVVLRGQTVACTETSDRTIDGLSSQMFPWRLVLPMAMLVVGLAAVYAWAARRQEQAIVKAMLAEDAGDWRAVVDHARQAATPWRSLDPLSTPVSFREGMGHLRLGDLAAARACLERARVENPNRMQILNNLGVLCADAGDFAQAIECFTAVTRRYPNQSEGFLNLANCYLDCGHAAAAVAILEQIPEAHRNDAVRASLTEARTRAAGK